jgi:hypothetical protein
MNIEKFYEALSYAIEIDLKLRLQVGLEAIRDTLSNIVAAPAQPQHQSALASALSTFRDAASALSNSFTPSQLSSLAEMGGEEYFDFRIAEKIQDSIEKNAMTPSVALDYVTNLVSKRAQFIETMKRTRDGLQELGAKSSGLTAGNADASFMIPRELFKNELGEFAKELTFLNKLVRDIDEAVTGTAEPVQLETLSSSIPTVAIMAHVGVIYVLAKIVDKFLESWERIERIRKARAELADLGIRKSALAELTDQIKTTVNDVVEGSVNLALEKYDQDRGRNNELKSALRHDTKRLFGQIERGLTIQFRVEPKQDADGEEERVFTSLSQISCKLQFPTFTSEPILLTNGEVLEDKEDQAATESAASAEPSAKTGSRRIRATSSRKSKDASSVE